MMSLLKVLQNRNVEKILWFCVFGGIVLHIVPFFYNRSLWVDEAMLISSICSRSFFELVASPLDWGQSAPIGWLLVVKLITIIWDNSEVALRFFSLVSAFGCMYFIYALLKNKVSLKFALWAVAIFALTSGYIYYGNEAKPYMSDNFFCLWVLFVWQKYCEHKIELYKLCLFYAIIIWFSFSAVFFIGACMIIECFYQIKTTRNMKKLLINGGLCSLVLLSFFANYIFWLSLTSSNAGGGDFWALLKFPLFPKSLMDLRLIVRMFFEYWSFYPRLIALLLFGLTFVGVILCFKQKKDRSNIVVPYVFAIILLLIASSIGFFPITGRLLQMLPIVSFVVIAFACDDLYKINFAQKQYISVMLFVVLACVLVLVAKDGCKNLFGRYVYKLGEEVSASVNYLNKNLTKDDVVYVYCHAIPVYNYEMNYGLDFNDSKISKSKKISEENYKELPRTFDSLPYQLNENIFGQRLVSFKYQIPYSYEYDIIDSAIQQDANMILKYNSVYLFVSHGGAGILNLIDLLRQKGTVEIVVESYKTPLYHFIRKNS